MKGNITEENLENKRVAKKWGWNSGRIIGLIVVLALFFLSAYYRKPYEGEGFIMSDATYHVLLTLKAYDETPSSIHKYLPIQTLGDECNKFIENGHSLIQDEYGNSFYVSFSPMGFYLPYFFCKLLHLSLSVGSLYLYNSLLMLISALLTGFIMYSLLRNKVIFYGSVLSYLVIPEVLYTQGIVYWHHSLSQVVLLSQILLFVKIFIERKQSEKILWVLFFVVSFIYPYLEWTGYVSNVGISIGILLLDLKSEKDNNGEKRFSVSAFSLRIVLALAVLTAGALVYYIFRFTSIAPANEIVAALTERAEDRNNASFRQLFLGYLESYWPLMAVGGCSLVISLILRSSRKEFRKIFANRRMWVMIFVFSFPLIENIVLKQHAVMYTFDRLKGCSVIVFVFAVSLYVLYRAYNKKALVYMALALCICTVTGLTSYGKGKIVTLDEYKDTIAMRDYLNENYIGNGEGVLVKSGWRAWGFLQSLYNRNIYCTAIYSEHQLDEIAVNSGSEYIVTLESTSGYDDTSCYTKAIVEEMSTSSYYQVLMKDGEVTKAELNDVYAAAVTDENWSNGIRRDDCTEILFENTKYNSVKLLDAQKLYCNGVEYTIVGFDCDDGWIRVFVDKDASECACPNVITVE